MFSTLLRRVAAPLRSPGFLIPSLLVLAVGLGAATAAFSLVERTLWRQLPGVLEPGRLVSIEFHTAGGTVPVSQAVLDHLDSSARTLESLISYSSASLNLGLEGAPPRRVSSQLVTEGFFQGIGGAIALGRGFSAEEFESAGEPVAVISHSLWREVFQGREEALGQTITVNSHRARIVGVTVRGFSGLSVLERADLWLPVVQMPMAVPFIKRFDPAKRSFFTVFARLTEGAAPASASAEIESSAAMVAEAMGYEEVRPVVNADASRPPFLSEYLNALLKPTVAVLLLVLVAAAANLVSLFLARGLARRQQAAVRHALGASRLRLCGDAFLEALFVAALGGAAALAVAGSLFSVFDDMSLLDAVPGYDGFTISWRLLLAAIAVAALCGLAAGTASAWSATRNLGQCLKEGSYSMARPARVRSLLGAVQIASSFAVLVAGGGFYITFEKLLAIDLGMNLRGVYCFSVEPQLNRYDDAETRRLYRELEAGLNRRPEISGAALVQIPPFEGTRRPVRVRDAGDESAEWVSAFRNRASAGYFEGLGVAVEGRDFASVVHERVPEGPVGVVITRSLAGSVWPRGGGVGRRLETENGGEAIVRGIADDHRVHSIHRNTSMLYEALGQGFLPGRMSVVFRGPPSEHSAFELARDEVERRDPDLAVFGSGALQARLIERLSARRLLAFLSSILAAAAIVLSSAGLYGTLSWSVLQRRREFGIRLALGSKQSQIAALGLRYTAVLVAFGTAGGALIVWLAGQWIEARLYGASLFEPWAVVWAVVMVVLCSFGAAIVPVVRSLSVEPVSILRAE
ncbi:MAG TPA: ABC transporter permease [Acidobacteriota bacterium]|nr:ABC transporter permease [Acidobacteriota bacterium]